ncbi:uncharacterized protein EDB91DRAFT_1226799 [Suillus paluster]|uniref:uncharacterized protein n=1 Tax=Suillus paluster TaxID=48578 RepID=UPI001B878114|nr:uncharacterized protein EDB91DRAFT_1226799 [Suillus paluster]KAG1731995.1 hypothetical protein EDB91DRAFT_1226799 [Suillus paluster]
MKDCSNGRASPTVSELTMHPALLVDDIVHAILQNVTRATDVIKFASTCSAISSPALDILWCTQSNLGPLIMCLPEDTWKVGNDNLIRLSREPLPTEWERVRINASRIRKLVSNPIGHRKRPPTPHRDVLQQLFAQFPPTSLFPNLVALDFQVVFDLAEFSANFSLLRQFLSPGLEMLAFCVPLGLPAHEVQQLVDAFPAEASGLRQLVISAKSGDSPCHIDLPLNKLGKLITLDVIRNVCLTRHSIADIGRMRSLQVLALTLHEESGVLEDSRLTGMPVELSALDRLTLTADRMQLCTSFLLRVITPHLSSININYTEYATPGEVDKLVLSLQTSCQSFALEEISIERSPHQDFNKEHSPLPSHLFRPLLKFRRLKTAKFFAMGKYCLDDAFIEDIAVAWPDIHDLRFASKETVNSTVTFAAMLSLASRCRSLRLLHLTFDATQTPALPPGRQSEGAPDRDHHSWPKQTALRMLHVGHSKVSTTRSPAFVLATVFPNLLNIASYQTPGVSYDIQWRQVATPFRYLVSPREAGPRMANIPSMFGGYLP